MPKPISITRLLMLAAILTGVALLVSGCPFAPRGTQGTTANDLDRIQVMLRQVESATPDELRALRDKWEKDASRLEGRKKPDVAQAADLRFAIAYALERDEQFPEAVAAYQQLGRTPVAAQASFRAAEITLLGLRDRKAAVAAYNQASRGVPFPTSVSRIVLWVRQPADPDRAPVIENHQWPSVLAPTSGRLELVPAWEAIQSRLDMLRQKEWRYKAVRAFVGLLGGDNRYSYALALILIAVIVKVATTPLTTSSFRSIRAMQALQPFIKELQEKHKGDRQALAAEQMRLMKKYKVNPVGGCLPMVIQFPILIGVYGAISFCIYLFRDAQFLWIKHLAGPDMPLLLLYAVSLYASQKLTAIPQADPEQQKMQNTMAMMMPVMLMMFLGSVASAFILYWFAYNVLITLHQYSMMRQPPPTLTAAGESPGGDGPGVARSRRRKGK